MVTMSKSPKKRSTIEIKSYDTGSEVDVDTWVPETPFVTFITINFTIGPVGEAAGSNFTCTYTTREALHVNGFTAEHATVFVTEFRWTDLLAQMRDRLAALDATEWSSACDELRKFLRWEYEGSRS